MISELDHSEVEALLGAYALDAVDREEAALVERHLDSCPRCRAELDGHRAVAGAVGNIVEPVPEGLWDRIAAQLDTADASPTPPPLRAVPEAMPPAGPTTVAAPPAGTVVGEPPAAPWGRADRRSRATRWTAAVVAVAAVVAAALLAVGLSHANSQVHQLQQAAGHTNAVEAALQTPGHRLVELRDTAGTELAEMVLVPDGRGYVVSSSLPSVASDQTYQLWAQSQGRFISIGLLGPAPQRGGGFTVASTTPSALAITVEPAGGVVSPDHAPVAEATIDA